jgi:hypothetical protein
MVTVGAYVAASSYQDNQVKKRNGRDVANSEKPGQTIRSDASKNEGPEQP